MQDLIQLLSKGLSAGKLTILCGAGISVDSGIPVVAPIVSSILECLNNKRIADGALPDSSLLPSATLVNESMRFETFMQHLIGGTRPEDHRRLFSIYKLSEPNHNHRILAKMMRHGLVREVFTTNFDTLLEYAAEDEGLVAGQDLQVCCAPFDTAGLVQERYPRIIKLHGSIDRSESLMITLKSISTEGHIRSIRPIIKRLFERKHSDDIVLVIGYSFSDDFDINTVLRKDIRCSKNIIIVDHNESEEHCVSLMEHRSRDSFLHLDGLVAKVSTTVLLRSLWENYACGSIQGTKPIDQVEHSKECGSSCLIGRDWRVGVADWANSLSTADIPLAFIWRSIGDFEKVRRLAESALKQTQHMNDLAGHFSAGMLESEAVNRLGESSEAQRIAMQMLRFARSISEVEAERKALAALAILRHKHRGVTKIGTFLGWVADRLTLGRSISLTMLQNRAISLCLSGNNRTATLILKRVVESRRRRGEIEEMAYAMSTLADVYARLDDHANAGFVFEALEVVYRNLGKKKLSQASTDAAEREHLLLELERSGGGRSSRDMS